MHQSTSLETLLDGTKRKGRVIEKAADFVVNNIRNLTGAPSVRDYKLFYRLSHNLRKMYESAVKNGMNYFAITDHDELVPVLEALNRNPDLAGSVIVGEEVSTQFKDRDYELHMGVYGLNEEQHADIQKAKGDLEGELVPFLREAGLLYTLNHPFLVPWAKKGAKITREDMEKLRELFEVVEKRNGITYFQRNQRAEDFFKDNGTIAGSDTHCGRVGRTFTMAQGATKEEFLESIKRGEAEVGGGNQCWVNIAREIASKPTSYGHVLYWDDPSLKNPDERMKKQMERFGQELVRFNGGKILRVPVRGLCRVPEFFIAAGIISTSPLWAVYHKLMDCGVEDF